MGKGVKNLETLTGTMSWLYSENAEFVHVHANLGTVGVQGRSAGAKGCRAVPTGVVKYFVCLGGGWQWCAHWTRRPIPLTLQKAETPPHRLQRNRQAECTPTRRSTPAASGTQVVTCQPSPQPPFISARLHSSMPPVDHATTTINPCHRAAVSNCLLSCLPLPTPVQEEHVDAAGAIDEHGVCDLGGQGLTNHGLVTAIESTLPLVIPIASDLPHAAASHCDLSYPPSCQVAEASASAVGLELQLSHNRVSMLLHCVPAGEGFQYLWGSPASSAFGAITTLDIRCVPQSSRHGMPFVQLSLLHTHPPPCPSPAAP